MKNIVNCYELDFAKDIPTEMNHLQNENIELISSNNLLKTSLSILLLVYGVIIIYQIWSKRTDEDTDSFKSNSK